MVTGRKRSFDAEPLPSTAIGETGDESAPLPVTIRGEDAGRQVRGSADLR
jgi:hypothetical protein